MLLGMSIPDPTDPTVNLLEGFSTTNMAESVAYTPLQLPSVTYTPLQLPSVAYTPLQLPSVAYTPLQLLSVVDRYCRLAQRELETDFSNFLTQVAQMCR